MKIKILIPSLVIKNKILKVKFLFYIKKQITNKKYISRQGINIKILKYMKL